MSNGNTRRGVTIRIFLIDGTPDGMRLSEKSGWTGSCLDFGRSDYGRARHRDELSRTGLYVLVGPDPDGGLAKSRLYVGEADTVRTRLDMHHRDRDFWTRAYVFTTRDDSLNKAHVRYLEARLVARAQQVRGATLENSTAPEARGLSEAEQHEMEAYLDEMLLLLPLLQVEHFTLVGTTPSTRLNSSPSVDTALTQARSEASSTPDTDAQNSLSVSAESTPLFFRERGRGSATWTVEAEGRDTPRGFVVLAGARSPAADKVMSPGYAVQRSRLREEGILVPTDDGQLVLTRDHLFKSPSAAATVIGGSNRPGPDVWKDAGGRSLAARRRDALEDPAG